MARCGPSSSLARACVVVAAIGLGGAWAFFPSRPLPAVSNAPVALTTPVVSRPSSLETCSISMISHGKRFRKLSRPADQRKALLRSLTTECIRHGRITTTLARAKEVRKHVDKMIQLGKRGDLHARRQALGWMYDKQLVHALFEQAGTRYADRNGGYTRVLRTMPRAGDNAPMGIIELV